MTRPSRSVAGLLALSAAALAFAAPAADAAKKKQTAKPLDGTFELAPGRLDDAGKPIGTYFRLRQPNGKYVVNPSSGSTDETYTLVLPGSAGGIVTGKFQRPPARAFDADGNSRAGAIIEPTVFAGVEFGLVTLPKDPRSGKRNTAPSFSHRNGKLTANLSALTAAWNKQQFNQGAPKPGAKKPLARGTYNKRTRAFTLSWKSKVVGGPFNGFTGVWRLEGTYTP